MNQTLYLLDDDIHSFDDVKHLLRRYLVYPETQCESIANIIHNNGRCDIYTGDDYMVSKYNEIFISNGFDTLIQDNYEV